MLQEFPIFIIVMKDTEAVKVQKNAKRLQRLPKNRACIRVCIKR